ncbi:MAG: formate/nitrite transporter family protein [Coprobacter fastidiosus]
MSTLPPSEIVISAEKSALQKIEFSTRTVILGILAGIYIAMGGLLSLLIGSGFPEITNKNPGLQKLLSGCMFPLGLILVVIAGADYSPAIMRF